MNKQTFAALLDQPLPRLVVMSGIFKAVILSMTGCMLFVELLALAITYSEDADKAGLKAQGIPVTAEITRMHTEPAKHSLLTYYVDYRFTLADPPAGSVPPYNKQERVDSDTYYQLRLGQEVAVLYYPLHPHLCALNIHNKIYALRPYHNLLSFFYFS